MGQRLSPTQFCIGGSYWASGGKHGTIAFKHDEARILSGEPLESGQRNSSISADADEPL
jgi:hypothetical protein